MKVEKKQVYVAPAVESRRIALEETVAAAQSIGATRVQVDDWDTDEIVLGADPATEGGTIYVPWQ
jgi:hypothetical protein